MREMTHPTGAPGWSLESLTTGLQLAVRAGFGAGLTLAIAQLLRLDFPLFAALAAIIATDLTPSQSRHLALRRVVATVVGAVCGVLLTLVLAPSAWSVGLSVFLTMIACELMHARDGAKVAGYLCSIIVLHHSTDPLWFALNRFIETMLGVAMAWLLSFVPKLIRVKEAEPQVRN